LNDLRADVEHTCSQRKRGRILSTPSDGQQRLQHFGGGVLYSAFGAVAQDAHEARVRFLEDALL
jgi:hypothetical protein